MTSTEHNQTDARPQHPTYSAYYASRGVKSKTEQYMRADAVRAAKLRKHGRNSESENEFRNSYGQAEQICARWEHHDSAIVRADWEYLTDALDDWRRSPGAMERRYEQVIIDRVDGVTDGMSPAEWRSQRQAREMASHGHWPQLQEAFADRSGNIHPVDPRSPEHWAHHSASQGEQLMRGDFAQIYLLDRLRGGTYGHREYMQFTEQMHAISEPWITRSDEFGETWRDMRRMSIRYNEALSEEAVDQLAQNYRSLARDIDDPLFSRSVEQLHQLGKMNFAGGFSEDSSRSPSAPVSAARAAARTAELARGNAFSGLSANAFASGGPERKGLAR